MARSPAMAALVLPSFCCLPTQPLIADVFHEGMMIKLIAPPDLGGRFSHKGQVLEVAEDGAVEIEEADAVALLAHGFRRSAEPEQNRALRADAARGTLDDVEAMSRIELFAFLRARGTPALPPIRNEELRARARALLAPAEGEAS